MSLKSRRAGERVSRGEEQRGAVIPIIALCLTVLVTATAMSVDIGREVAENRLLQRSADALAMDTARVVDGTTQDSSIRSQTDKAFNASASRNNISTVVGDPTYAVYVLGTWDQTSATFTPDALSTDTPNAVQVTAYNSFSNTFGNVVAPGGQTLQRSAVSSNVKTASLSLDTAALAAQVSGPSILNKVLDGYLGNGNLSITAVGYQSLASTSLTLGQLAAAGDYASVTQLLNASLTIPQWASLGAQALDQAGQSSSSAATALAAVAASSTTSGTFQMGSLVGTASGSTGAGGNAASYNVNLLAMLMGGGQIANGQNFLNNNFGVSVPITDPTSGNTLGSVSITSLQFTAISGKQEWNGLPPCSTPPCPYTEHTSQVTLQALGIQFTIGTVSFNLSVSLSVAQGSGYVQDINCATPSKFDANRDQVWWSPLSGTLNGGTVTVLLGLPVTLSSNTSLGVVVSGPGGGSQQTNWFQATQPGWTWPSPEQSYSAGSFAIGSAVQQAIFSQMPTLSSTLGAAGQGELVDAVNDAVYDVTPAINLVYGGLNVGAPYQPQCGADSQLVK